MVATFSIQAMIWPPKVLTWWFACGGSTSSTLSTRVLSAGTAPWYSWHSPGARGWRWRRQNGTLLKSIKPESVPPRRKKKTPHLLPVPSWAVLLLSRSVMISAWMSLILLRSAARLYSICSICVWGITCFSCTWTHTHTHREDAAVAEKKKGPLITFWQFRQPSPPLFVWPQKWRRHGKPSTVCQCTGPRNSPGCPPEMNSKLCIHLLYPLDRHQVKCTAGESEKQEMKNSTDLHAGSEGPVDLCNDVDHFSHPTVDARHKTHKILTVPATWHWVYSVNMWDKADTDFDWNNLIFCCLQPITIIIIIRIRIIS